MRTRIEHFRSICEKAGNLFAIRNRQYGDAIKETGVLGATVELIAVIARLRVLILQDPATFQNDAVRLQQIHNAFIDAHNYANIGAMMLDEGNWRGVGNDKDTR